jgi:filamentous hemagglutinin family protein
MSDIALSHRIGPPLIAVLLVAGPVQAQIVTDGSVGPKASLHGGQIEIGSDLGTRRGDNLFHSFEKFGIASGQTATFTGPGAIRNVISRVTGGEVSNINGKLASTVGQADLYFLNPAGVIFGPNAKLDVPGSFHVSTAHELRFADGTHFSTLDKTGSGLTVAPPEAFGFLDRAPKGITVDKSQLRLQPAKTLSLVGGDLMIDGGQTGSVRTEDGVVQLVSAAAPGVVRIADVATMVGQGGEVRVTQSGVRLWPVGSVPVGSIDVSGRSGGGTIRIDGGRVVLDGAWIFANNYGSRDSTGGIDVQADAIAIRQGLMTMDAFGFGKAGMVTINADVLELHDGGVISSSTFGPGDAGQVTVNADRLLVTGFGQITSSAQRYSTGSAGTVAVSARELEMHDGGQILSVTFSSGNAKQVTVNADRLLISGAGAAGYPSQIASSAQPGSTGQAGTVTVSAHELELHDGGVISSSAQPYSIGSAGTVTVSAYELELHDGGVISSATFGPGDAGQITVNADRLLVTGFGQIISRTFASGNAGQVTVNADHLLITDFGQISSSTFASGNAGQVTVNADYLLIDGNSSVIASSVQPHSTGRRGR